ncbi:methyl-accepting chemotaxis protein [Methylotenera sp.]|uniref:methyl-accepting chemotaxis protein n=1 Tax=Methylotenera sp. TaxID=2051956 RepID=UPI002731DAB3|nr:methyl-accepting chemotaxis protein [Methylotenera sp.]MDP2072020.1 methyl-accepting chemotaxis protein [Methylotenera sp.]MDP2230605.1 methyl-accepting chemotaxis protein [Methylotenera sp.]MDP3006971.1 methyl-accepting chemotaxis protein [Methylotenera sp.]MDP3007092.1 methyl-accepting chemotaxis protein [Methylotenera sp.]MDP3141850.1 methyl-accepting chemotaxis protein [Methylotenera sp.]
MALNLASIKSLPLQIGEFLNKIKSKTSGSGSSKAGSLKGNYRQLYLQIFAFILFAALSFWVINQVRVNGPVYNTLKEYQFLVSDTSSPQLYPVDAFSYYNQAYVASTNFNNEKRDRALANAAKFEALFKERSAYWQQNLNNDKLKGPLEASVKAGENFFRVAHTRYIPSLPLGTVAASAPLSDLTAAFEVAQQTSNTFILAVRDENNSLIESQTNFIKFVLFGLLLLGLILVLLMYFFGKKQVEQSTVLTDQLAKEGQDNQEAVLQLLDEMGDLADGDLTVKAEVRDSITGAIADSINYTIDSLRDLVVEINRATEQVTSATSVAQGTSSQLLAAAETQSEQILQTTDAVTDMTRSILQVSSNAAQASQVAQRSLEAANQGSQAVQNTISGMNEIRTQIQETSKRIKRLGESSQEISEIVELISDITEQTNILALNAAIQAASAGEAGRGFTVVAEEVQRLAERSSEATKQISAIVKTIQTDTHGAVVAMEKSTEGVVEGARVADAAGQALTEIETVTNNLARLIQAISTATNAQTESATMVANNMQLIQEITTQTSEGTQLTADSVGQLTSLAEELRSSVAGFKL